ncbi:ABC transporter permease [Candidatus Soleaferrea massiliensis]|uniref:ABC transporter permease n=1 Tax=Candidatus Soleaferrea massiliensis TaxID=1470354 RepID=UPI00058E5643|nr:ABC transporter permease [Candidatus Soleaferrea massiliensis]
MNITMVLEHLYIVLLAVVFTIAVGLPLGVLAYYFKKVRQVILWMVDILQTVPALALLGIIMVFLGAGKLTVIIGLVLYSLLPVVHNTYLGLSGVEPAIKEAARGMGMTKMYRLIHVELPIAFPMVFTGIRIATVTAVGVAVFATFVGGGGLGSVIYNGIRIQNTMQILTGTLTLVVMAVAIDFVMAYIEKRLYRRSSTK